MNRKSLPVILCFALSWLGISAQPISFKQEIINRSAPSFERFNLFAPAKTTARQRSELGKTLSHVEILSLQANEIDRISTLAEPAISIALSYAGITLDLDLVQAAPLAPDFRIISASGKRLRMDQNLYYWGIVNGQKNSLAAITIYRGQISGLIAIDDQIFNLVKEENADSYLLFREGDLLISNPFDCFTDEEEHWLKQERSHQRASNADNCVNMYVEVDYDIVQGKGSAQAAADYVLAAFNQVAILYANEGINLQVSEMKVWDVQDPYNFSSTSDYLYAFRDALAGNYNGDLAHLVGYQGGGGIAYVDVVCNPFYGVGYSDINSNFSNVPTYSWTIEVLTHEIGHNLGSPHTHACAWNGNNTAIDGCGSSLGYGGCNGPIPAAGTIMSYCHLVGGVGIDFNLGFGPQPGDLIRDRVYNATCLSSCGTQASLDVAIIEIIQPLGDICENTVTPTITIANAGTETLTSVQINYSIDGSNSGTTSWTGSLPGGSNTQVNLDPITITTGTHVFEVTLQSPNGATDENGSNNSLQSSYSGISSMNYYADADGDGYGNPLSSVEDCQPPTGYVSDNTDCNDNDVSAYPGASCDDGDACTTNDRLDANCNCSGTFTDSDGDGVCDAEDQCPGGDDGQDSDGDGIPDYCDCNLTIASFSSNTLNHSGSGSSIETIVLGLGSLNPFFTISDLSAQLNGNPRNRFQDMVTVTFIDGAGVTRTFDTFDGSITSSVQISIDGEVQSISVSLTDGADGSSPGQSVRLGEVQYCTTDDCPDSDGDGVCDDNDQCEGYPDDVDTDGDGVPDGCDVPCDQTTTDQFPDNPLVHSGSGSTSTIMLLTGQSDLNFTISGMDAKTNGNAGRRYAEIVSVYFNDGSGEKLWGTFSGENVNSIEVNLPGLVAEVRVELSDGYNNGQGLSIDLSEVTSCVSAAGISENSKATSDEHGMGVYPNPARDHLMVRFDQTIGSGTLHLYDLIGHEIDRIPIRDQNLIRVDLTHGSIPSGMFILTMHSSEGITFSKKIMVVK